MLARACVKGMGQGGASSHRTAQGRHLFSGYRALFPSPFPGILVNARSHLCIGWFAPSLRKWVLASASAPGGKAIADGQTRPSPTPPNLSPPLPPTQLPSEPAALIPFPSRHSGSASFHCFLPEKSTISCSLISP